MVSNYGVDTTGMTFSASVTSTNVSMTITYTFSSIVPLLSIPDISLSAMSQLPLSAS